MSSEEVAMEVAMNFYEEKPVVKVEFLAIGLTWVMMSFADRRLP